ncbi:hypothetical protein CRENBAI_020784 [Crenichthys baileyi]|uniref:Uncharacterized protein n=1 Tax=Crenichthys baileyi TaxID=28760 RepID=A0AAV9QQC9_9TELE
MDLFTFLSREVEKTLRRSAGLSVPQSAYDGSRLVIPCPGTGPLRRCSSPPLHTAVKPSSSSRRKKHSRGAPSCVSASEAESPTAAAAKPLGNSLAHWWEGCSKYSRIFVCYSTVSQAPCSKYSRIFVCLSKVSQARCSSAHAVFSPVF